MVLSWISMRWTSSSRSLIAVLLVFAIAIPFSYFHPYDFHSQPSSILLVPDPIFEVSLNLTPASDLEQGQVPEHTGFQYRPLGEHKITPDGLLVVNPEGAHPIFQLIRDAEAEWQAKLEKASRTLDEAVAEYRRRYHRAPPLGFDKWWDYVTKHRVQLPDEYDEIFEDIEPFWGIDPAELAHTQEQLEARVGAVTLFKGSSGFEVARSTLQEGRQHLMRGVNAIFALVREVEHDLPPIRLTISPFDNPGMLSDWQILTMARQAAANKTTLKQADLPPVSPGWINACPPGSPARLHPPTLSRVPFPPLPPSSHKSFIVSHRDAMDPCAHPWLMNSHGQFLSHKSGPRPESTLVPRFSLCSTTLHHDIRPPFPYGWDFESDDGTPSDEYEAFDGDLRWEQRIDERLGWRGRTTGMWAAPNTMWENGHRARLVTLVNSLEGNVSVLRVPKNEDGEEEIRVGEPEVVRLARVNPAWMDIAFTEGPIGCDQDGGTCEKMKELWEFRRMQERHEEGRYKFILDVDGNGWSGRFKRLITSNALIFKATIYPEWYTSRIAPWVHYVPIQISYADLYDVIAFFRIQEELAARIAKAGQDWSRQFWRREDMTAYLYRLLLEYARVTSLDRESMNYVG